MKLLQSVLAGSALAVQPHGHGTPREPVKSGVTNQKNLNDYWVSPKDADRLREAGFDMTYVNVIDENSGGRKRRGITDGYSKWQPLETGGPVMVPYGIFSDLADQEDMIKGAMAEIESDLACFSMPYLDATELLSTTYPHGIIYVLSSQGCYSSLGVWEGFVGNTGAVSVTDFGVPETWQIIALEPSCNGHATVQHELMHALGVNHEHNRPDRDEFLSYNPSATFMPQSYDVIPIDDWFDLDSPLEVESVMTYCSFCSSIGNDPVMTIKSSGATFSDGYRVTTTDAKQLQWMYCESDTTNFPNFQYKETANCTSGDLLGFTREIFTDRICDGLVDCGAGEDEDGSLAECEPKFPETALGCCGGFNMGFAGKCVSSGETFNDKDVFDCDDGSAVVYEPWFGSWLLMQADKWPIVNGEYGWWSEIETEATCPPLGVAWDVTVITPSCIWDGVKSDGSGTTTTTEAPATTTTDAPATTTTDASATTTTTTTTTPEETTTTTDAPSTGSPGECTQTFDDSVVSCDGGFLQIEIPLCSLEEKGFMPAGIFMEAAGECRGRVEGGNLVFDTLSPNCTVDPTMIGDSLVYNSTIFTKDNGVSNGIISRQFGIELEFSCVLETKQTLSLEQGIQVNVNHFIVDLGEKLGSFNVRMAVYDSPDFAEPTSADHIFSVPDKVFVEVKNDDSQLAVALENCIAFPEDSNGTEYALIENACPSDDSTSIISSGLTPEARFEFASFQFVDSSAPISIECDISICDPTEGNCNVCMISRKRRASSLLESKKSRVKVMIKTDY